MLRLTQARYRKGFRMSIEFITNQSQNDRFNKYVQKTDNCWEWTGGTFDGRYGQFRVGKRKVKAHRYAWAMAGRELPPEKILCHKCDNERCVNPDHLFVGTYKDNSEDREAKGRGSGNRYAKRGMKGQANPASKITDAEAQSIYSEYAHGGVTKTELSIKYNISLSQVVNITLKRMWKHV
jgi:hypothetical protein